MEASIYLNVCLITYCSSTMACSDISGLKLGAGSTIVAPWVIAAIIAITTPYTWNNGTWTQIRWAFSSSWHRFPTCMPLLTKLKWLKTAAFGVPVVPEVNWMLHGLSGWVSRGLR